MSTSTAAKPDADRSTSDGDTPIVDRLRDVARQVRTQNELYRKCFRALTTHFDSPAASVQIDGASTSIEERHNHGKSSEQAWQKIVEGFALNARYQNTACGRLYRSEETGLNFGVLATPISEVGGPPIGSLVIVTRCSDRTELAARLDELQALCGMMAALSTPRGPSASAAPPKASGTSGLTRASEYESFHEFAFAIVNNLKSKVGCDQVCLGRVVGRRVKMASISGLDDLYPRSPGARRIEQAMEECLDANSLICCQKEEQWTHESAATGHRIHQLWHVESGNAPVASIPLCVDDRCVAVLSMRNPTHQVFRPDQVKKIADLVTPLVPGLLLLEKAGQSLPAHAMATVRHRLQHVFGPGGRGRRIASLILTAAVLWIVFGSQRYVVSVSCTVVPTEIRQISAPFDGTIAAVYVEPGERVEAGQSILKMDTASLDMERRKAEAKRNLAQIEMLQASDERDYSSAARARARLKMANVQLAAIDHRLQHAEIRAPVEGVILSGDLLRRVGEVVPLGEALVQVSPHGASSIELQVPEHQALYLMSGQHGEFTTNARPDEATGCVLGSIAPSSVAFDGANIFVATCQVEGAPPVWMRSGMNGIARISTDKRPVWWVWLHRILDSARMQLWKI